MQFSKEVALQLCALNSAGYSLATTGHCVLPDGFSEPIPIRLAQEHRPLFLIRDPLDIFGFVTEKDGKLYIVFRGTQITSGFEFLQEWMEDVLSLPLHQFGTLGHVHLGFYGAWMALRQATVDAIGKAYWPALPGNGGRIITGHSLGAAIATLCWADLGGDMMSIACPRVGDPDFASSLWKGQTVRVINAPDIVPRVPTDPPFRHGGTEVKVDGPGGGFDWHIAHSLDSYVEGLNKWTATPS